MATVQEPTVTPFDQPGMTGKHYDHPAYGQIGASRVTSSHGQALYGSDLAHRAMVVIRIYRSQLTRTLSHDFHHAGNEIVEVSLSEAQWATFVSSLNIGDGVPCTLERVGGETMPNLPLSAHDTEFKNEVRETVIAALTEINAAIDEVKATPIARGKRDGLLACLHKAAQHLRNNLPFVADSFDRHVEKTVESAKAEVGAYLTAAVTRAGLVALSSLTNPLLMIEDSSEKGDLSC